MERRFLTLLTGSDRQTDGQIGSDRQTPSIMTLDYTQPDTRRFYLLNRLELVLVELALLA